MAGEIGVTEVAATQQDLVASLVQMTLKQEAKLLATITDYSAFAVPGAKSVAIPRRNQMAAADKTENTDLTAQTITFSSDVIDLTKHKAIYAKLEDIAGVQANVSVRAEIIVEMARELALQVDKDIITALKVVSTAGPDHLLDYDDSAGDTLALVDFAEARRLLFNQNVPMDDNLFCIIPPDKEKDLLGISNFISAEQYGSREALLNGEIGRVFGFKVLIHTSLGTNDTLMYHKSHTGYASQFNPSMETDRELKSTSDEFLLQMIYGAETLDQSGTGGGVRGVYYNGTGA